LRVTPEAIFLPFKIEAAAAKSTYFAPVQAPMYATSKTVLANSSAFSEFSGECGAAIWGDRIDASNSVTFALEAGLSKQKLSSFLVPHPLIGL
jgi:hypothetical protein